jgi:CheY-like chemotaxis protein/DNA-binding XRE family transcriptional regulator
MLSTAELVARIREHTGDTQEALAQRLGVSFPTINSWERGRSRPRPTHRRQLEALADELGIRHEFKVLVIDDDPATAEMVAAAAVGVDPGIEVDRALDGWEGLIKCGSLQPELIFLDIMMPGIDGLEVAKRLPSIEGLTDTTVLFVTSAQTASVLERARAIGHRVLPKPLEIDDLETAIRRVREDGTAAAR